MYILIIIYSIIVIDIILPYVHIICYKAPVVYSEIYQINGNFRILKWRYVSTIFQTIFCGDIP